MSFQDNIQIQGINFYPPLFWKNTLSQMLEYLHNEQLFKFQNLSLELILVRDSEIALYNHDYMNCTGPTNILSFPHEDEREMYNNETDKTFKEQHNSAYAFSTPINPFLNKKKHSSKSKIILRSNLGTLILSVDTLERECVLYGQKPHRHATHLLAHGLAHLLGYDHGEEMQQLTELLERNISYKNKLHTFTPVWSFCHG